MAPQSAPGTARARPRAAAGPDLAAEVERLRTLIEKQASCLVRVGLDGTLLAVSDAALSLLGARELAQVLNTSFIDRLHGEAASVWADFVDRVSYSGSASAECEMTDLSGAHRAVILLGVAQAHHPDGLDSVLVTVRDVSTARRLEASLQEQEGLRRSIDEERTKLATALADREGLELAVADRATIQEALDDATKSLQQLRGKLEEVIAERRRLHASLDEVLAERRQLQASLDEVSTERGQLRAALDEATANIEQLRTRLDAAGAERPQLRAALAEAMAQRQQIADAFEQLTSTLGSAMDAASLARQALGKPAPK